MKMKKAAGIVSSDSCCDTGVSFARYRFRQTKQLVANERLNQVSQMVKGYSPHSRSVSTMA